MDAGLRSEASARQAGAVARFRVNFMDDSFRPLRLGAGLGEMVPDVYPVKCCGPFTPFWGTDLGAFLADPCPLGSALAKKNEKKKAPAFPQGPFSKTEMWVQCFIISFRGGHRAVSSLFQYTKKPPWEHGGFLRTCLAWFRPRPTVEFAGRFRPDSFVSSALRAPASAAVLAGIGFTRQCPGKRAASVFSGL